MGVEITKITIKNFKNLKNVTIRPRKFNVLVGPNGSGKTNFLEFFKLLRKIYVERNPYPFLEWDGYENVVWNHQRYLPIEFEIETVERMTLLDFLRDYWINSVKLEKNMKITVIRKISSSIVATASENVKILKEVAEVKIPELGFYFTVVKEGNMCNVILNKEKYKATFEAESMFFEISKIIEEAERFGIEDIIFEVEDSIIADIFRNIPTEKLEEIEMKIHSNILKFLINDVIIFFDDGTRSNLTISYIILRMAPATIVIPFLLLYRSLILFTPNLQEIKYKPKIFPIEEPLKERGENALDILAQLQFKNGKLPDRIEYFVENYFNGKLYFKGIAPGRLNLYYSNGKTEISKEHLPDGLMKALVVLTAMEQKPSILLIDEIENSLHPELLEFLIAVLREEGNCVFVTTHSPVVLDLVEPEEIFVFKPDERGEGVEVKNVTDYKSKEELEKELEELGLKLSEKVFYGIT
jgi:predicted ATPase